MMEVQNMGFAGWLDGGKASSQPVTPLEYNVFGCPLCGYKVRSSRFRLTEASIVIICTAASFSKRTLELHQIYTP